MQTAELGITVGETYDFEYEASTPQELTREVYLPGPKLRVTQGLVFATSVPETSLRLPGSVREQTPSIVGQSPCVLMRNFWPSLLTEHSRAGPLGHGQPA